MAKKILITDDSPTILAIMSAAVSGAGYEVITAVDGQDALDKVKKEPPDLVVLDLMLPKVDGYKVCAMLKFDKRLRSIPVIILTARTDEADRKLGEEVMADAYITKPFDPEALIKKIKELSGE